MKKKCTIRNVAALFPEKKKTLRLSKARTWIYWILEHRVIFFKRKILFSKIHYWIVSGLPIQFIFERKEKLLLHLCVQVSLIYQWFVMVGLSYWLFEIMPSTFLSFFSFFEKGLWFSSSFFLILAWLVLFQWRQNIY